jgi:hypothetical protein
VNRSGVLLLAAVATGTSTPALAQSAAAGPARLKLSGSVRLRYEAIDGQPRAGFNRKDDLTSLRTTLRAEYDAAPSLGLVAEMFDSRAYGGNRGTPVTNNEVNAVELVQAYAEARIGDPKRQASSATIRGGRFLLNVGSRRLVSADDYRNTTSGYTGIDAEIAGPHGLKASLIYVLPQQRRPDQIDALLDNKVALDRESFDLVLWGGMVSRAHAIGPALAEITYFHLGEDDSPGRPNRNRSLDTFGGRVIREPKTGAADYEVEGFYQSGRIRSGIAANAARLDVSAWFVHADAGYTFAGAWKPRLSVEYDRASGDGPGSSFGRFDTLFGMRRPEFAPSGLYSSIGRANISTPGVRVEAVPSKRIDWMVTYKAMWLADRHDAFSTTGVRDASGRSGSFAGHQLDGRIRYWIVPQALRLEFNGSFLAKGRFLKSAPNASNGRDVRYASFNLSATF